MTVGAAGGLNVILKTLLNPGDEVIAFAPFFGEYRSYTANFDGVLVVVSPNTVDFQPNLDEFAQKITPRTKGVIINTPNNPTGVVYSAGTLERMADILRAKEKEYGTAIVLISDEPYRELAYDGVEVPYVTKYYANTIVGYSYSKSLSLPGERIGYLVIPNEVADYARTWWLPPIWPTGSWALSTPPPSSRRWWPTLPGRQRLNLEGYNKNRELLYSSLKAYGYDCVKPEGAFYLFVKALEPDDGAFAAAAKKHNILIVPGSSFACPGYCRIAYCVDYKTIENALPGFKALAEEYGVCPKA